MKNKNTAFPILQSTCRTQLPDYIREGVGIKLVHRMSRAEDRCHTEVRHGSFEIKRDEAGHPAIGVFKHDIKVVHVPGCTCQQKLSMLEKLEKQQQKTSKNG